jgi:hypothetical protein
VSNFQHHTIYALNVQNYFFIFQITIVKFSIEKYFIFNILFQK